MLQLITLCLFCTLLSSCASNQVHVNQRQATVEVDFDRERAAKARLDLALSYLHQDNYLQAKHNLDKALSFAPHVAEVHLFRAYYLQKIGEDSLAAKHYRQAYKLAPDDPDVLHNYGSFLCSLNQYQQAKGLLIAAVRSPNYAQAGKSLLNLAYCSIELGYFSAGLQYLAKANKHMPKSSEVILMAAGVNFSLANVSKAVSWYQKYEELAQVSAKGALLGWLIYQELSLCAEAERLKRLLLSRFPQSLEAKLLKNRAIHRSEFWQLRERATNSKLYLELE